ncbi:DUF916 domain-containing protein [Streptomyces sp. SID3343]|uniref:COG1470 family protein n=1 Tax=Streptomyces sp. SID3343 TaxID=2690260 RepID=UPI00136E76E0|nr:DUF916 domain-containing protein [Streptomyces sp. SID3343]MYW03650.1 DUF916 domain-containing protein [Streptomyces sp. SID3343]
MTGTPALLSRRQGERSRSLAALIGVLATLFASLILVTPTPASAAGNGEWSVDPYVPDGTSQNARRYFFLEGALGTTVPDVVTVHNTSPAPMTVKLFGADAYNTPRDGGFALRTASDKQVDVGTWIQIAPENQTLTLQPGEKRQVPFNVVIPPNATPGDHPGAVVALNTAIEGTQQQGQVKVNIQRQIGARVYLRVQGPTLAAMDVQKVEVKRNSGFGEFFGSTDATITYRVVNRGNVIIKPDLDLRAEGMFGRTLLNRSDKGTEILPGQSVVKTVPWKDAPRLDRVSIKVKATTDDPGVKDNVSASYTAVPWPILLTVALILVAGGVAWSLWRNNRKGGKGGDPAKPDAPTGPTDDTTVLPPVPAEPSDDNSAASAETSGRDESKDEPAESKPVAEPAKTQDAPAEPAPATAAEAEPETAEPANEPEAEAVSESDGKPESEGKPVPVAKPAAAEANAADDTSGDTGPAATDAEPESTPATSATDPTKSEVADPAAESTTEPVAEPAAEAAPAKKSAKRPKGKQSPTPRGNDTPAAEESADSAGVGR